MRETDMNPAKERRSSSSKLRRESVAFLIKCAAELRTPPIVKYSALSLLSDRFYPSLFRLTSTSIITNNSSWLLQNPNRAPNLQLFALIALWISSKIHDSPPLSLKTLKSTGDKHIADQHFTKRDYLDAETAFLKTLGFEIGTLKNSAFLMLEELVMKLKAVAKDGERVSFEACLDVMDLVYEREEIARLVVESPITVAAGVLVAGFVMTVLKKNLEFPVLSWLKLVTGCRAEDVLWFVKLILEHILRPCPSV